MHDAPYNGAMWSNNMAWIFILTGITLIISVNIPGAYHKDRMPSGFIRIAWTLAGSCFVYLGFHRLGFVPF